jgi:hypothetical protein
MGEVHHYRLVKKGELQPERYVAELGKNVTDNAAHAYADLLQERLEKLLASDAARQCQISRELWLSDEP